MKRIFVCVIVVFLSGCVGQGGKELGSNAYEVFVAKVSDIEVPEKVNVAEPLKVGISGKFEDDCSELERISVDRSDSVYNIELSVYGRRSINSKCNAKVVPFTGSITITGLQVGRYRIRINKDDNLIRYFSVIEGSTLDASFSDINIDVGTDINCTTEIAPVSSADITTDGLNSANNQKIPYGTPINLVVKGKIVEPCHSFYGFDYKRIGSNLYVDVLARYCEDVCIEDKVEYNETYVITGLTTGSYTLFVNNQIRIQFEVVD